MKEAKLKQGYDVLDLGSGGNILVNYLDQNLNYTSVDYFETRKNYVNSKEDVKRINHNLEKGLPNELKDRKFDVIFILEFIEHIENFRSLLLECKKILKPNGEIIITTPTNHRFLIGEDKTHIHCFRKTNIRNLANMLNMNCSIKGVFIKIPKINLFIPSKQLFYNEMFLIKLTLKKNATN